MDEDQQQKLSDFVQITGVSESQGREILERNKWNLQSATDNHFSSKSSKQKTLSDIKGKETKNGTEEWYAGGEKSGVAIQGAPDEKKKKAQELVGKIMEQAIKGGQERGGEENEQASFFTGAGRRLGAESDIPTSSNSTDQDSNPPEKEKVFLSYLTFRADGFSLDDGPLLRYDDPANQAVLQQINSGRVPPQLFNVPFDKQIDIKVVQKMDQEYTTPVKKILPFQGAGNRLGAVVPKSPSSDPFAMPGSFPSSSTAPVSPPQIDVDLSKPVTSIQIRLADGTRMVSKFNHTHTIGDIRNYIRHSRREYANANFALQTPLPVKVFEDDSVTVAEAKLINSVIAQRMIL